MDLHDGRISVMSLGEGYGSTFTMELPISNGVRDLSSLRVQPLTSYRFTNNDYINQLRSNNNNNRISESSIPTFVPILPDIDKIDTDNDVNHITSV
jgi:hypothetical protein